MSKGLFFDDENPGVEFEHVEGWKVSLRICTMAELERIRKETTAKKVNYKTVDGRPHRFVWDEVNEEKQSQMIWDYCITGWEGIYNKQGEMIPCTPDNKLLLMKNSQAFAQFVTDSMRKLNKDEEDLKTESEKN